MKIDDNDDKIHKKGQKKYTSAKHTHPEKEKVSEKRPQDDFFLSLSHKRYAKSGIETNTAQHWEQKRESWRESGRKQT